MTRVAPEPLAARHRLAGFSSGTVAFDAWLERHALDHQESGAFRTFVACEADRAIGYYALATGKIVTIAAPGRFRANTPAPIPVVVLARLAVESGHQGRGLGRALFRDAARRVLHAADAIGIRGILVSATSERARAFAAALGCEPSPIEPMILLATLDDLRAGQIP